MRRVSPTARDASMSVSCDGTGSGGASCARSDVVRVDRTTTTQSRTRNASWHMWGLGFIPPQRARPARASGRQLASFDRSFSFAVRCHPDPRVALVHAAEVLSLVNGDSFVSCTKLLTIRVRWCLNEDLERIFA